MSQGREVLRRSSSQSELKVIEFSDTTWEAVLQEKFPLHIHTLLLAVRAAGKEGLLVSSYATETGRSVTAVYETYRTINAALRTLGYSVGLRTLTRANLFLYRRIVLKNVFSPRTETTALQGNEVSAMEVIEADWEGILQEKLPQHPYNLFIAVRNVGAEGLLVSEYAQKSSRLPHRVSFDYHTVNLKFKALGYPFMLRGLPYGGRWENKRIVLKNKAPGTKTPPPPIVTREAPSTPPIKPEPIKRTKTVEKVQTDPWLDDPQGYYDKEYPGMTRGQLLLKNPEFYNFLKSEAWIVPVPIR